MPVEATATVVLEREFLELRVGSFRPRRSLTGSIGPREHLQTIRE